MRRTSFKNGLSFTLEFKEQNESVDSFISDLRGLARTCKFVEDSTDFTNQMIRGRAVLGVSDISLCRKLCAKGDILLEKTVKMCRGRGKMLF